MQIEEIQKRWKSTLLPYLQSIEPTSQSFALSHLSAIPLSSIRRVAQFGCGGGLILPYLIQHFHPDVQYQGYDLTQDMIDTCKKRAQGFQVKNFKFVVQNCQTIQLEAEVYNLVIANLIVHLTPNSATAVGNAYKCLQKGGKMLVTVWGRKSKMMKGLVDEALGPRTGGFRFNTREKLKSLLEGEGFKVERMWTQTYPFNYASADEQSLGAVTKFENRVVESYSKEQLEAIQKQMTAVIRERLDRGEPLVVESILAICTK